jgi:hypothetical protein
MSEVWPTDTAKNPVRFSCLAELASLALAGEVTTADVSAVDGHILIFFFAIFN